VFPHFYCPRDANGHFMYVCIWPAGDAFTPYVVHVSVRMGQPQAASLRRRSLISSSSMHPEEGPPRCRARNGVRAFLSLASQLVRRSMSIIGRSRSNSRSRCHPRVRTRWVMRTLAPFKNRQCWRASSSSTRSSAGRSRSCCSTGGEGRRLTRLGERKGILGNLQRHDVVMPNISTSGISTTLLSSARGVGWGKRDRRTRRTQSHRETHVFYLG
jgi:hypothetical protein